MKTIAQVVSKSTFSFFSTLVLVSNLGKPILADEEINSQTVERPFNWRIRVDSESKSSDVTRPNIILILADYLEN